MRLRDSTGYNAFEAAEASGNSSTLQVLQQIEASILASASRHAKDRFGQRIIRCTQCGIRVRQEELERHATYVCVLAPKRGTTSSPVLRTKWPQVPLELKLKRIPRARLFTRSYPGNLPPLWQSLDHLRIRPSCERDVLRRRHGDASSAECSVVGDTSTLAMKQSSLSLPELGVGNQLWQRNHATHEGAHKFIRSFQGRHGPDGTKEPKLPLLPVVSKEQPQSELDGAEHWDKEQFCASQEEIKLKTEERQSRCPLHCGHFVPIGSMP